MFEAAKYFFVKRNTLSKAAGQADDAGGGAVTCHPLRGAIGEKIRIRPK
jgi:hypothetical protein